MAKILDSNIIGPLSQKVSEMVGKLKPLSFKFTIPSNTKLSTTLSQLGQIANIPNGKYLGIATVRVRSYPSIDQENGIDLGIAQVNGGSPLIDIEDYFPAGTLGVATSAFAKKFFIIGEIQIGNKALYLRGRKGFDIGSYIVDNASIVLIPLDS